MRFSSRIAVSATMVFACLVAASLSRAQSVANQSALVAFPEKPITLVVPWNPGGSTDTLARVLAAQWSDQLGQVVVVENKPGASGNIGSNSVAKASPDGYTLLVGIMSTHTINPAVMPSMPFDAVADFTPIAQLANVVNTLVVHPSVPVNNVREFIDYAKENPGKLNYASSGLGSANFLSTALFENATGVQMVHVPYKGGAPAVQDLIAGHTQVMFTAATQTVPHSQAGNLKLLAVTEPKRSALLPDVPTVGETVPGYELTVWYGLFGPANMPAELVARLNAAANQAMAQPAIRQQLEAIGVELVSATPEAFASTVRADAQRYGALIRDLGIKTE